MILEPRGKQRICSTPLSYYDRIMSVGNKPIYRRYDAVRSFLSAKMPAEDLAALAEPVYDDADDSLLWYAAPAGNDEPTPLTALQAGPERERYASLKEQFAEQLRSVSGTLPDEERYIIQGVLSSFRDEYVFCYDGRIALVAWGMYPTKDQYDPAGVICVHTGRLYEAIFDYGAHGAPVVPTERIRKFRKGAKITQADLPGVAVREGFKFLGWEPAFDTLEVESNMLFTARYEAQPTFAAPRRTPPAPPKNGVCAVGFATDGHAMLSFTGPLTWPIGEAIPESEFPHVAPHRGYEFLRWDPAHTLPPTGDCTFTAITQEVPLCLCSFDLGEHGVSDDATFFTLPRGERISSAQLPAVRPLAGYAFLGWDCSPTASPIEEDTTFTALYDSFPVEPAVVRVRRRRTSVWSWLRWLLLSLLLLLLLSLLLGWLFRSCSACAPYYDRDDRPGQVDTLRTGDGRRIDDNGSTLPGGDAPSIIGDDGRIPDRAVVPPVVGNDGNLPPIISQPDEPDVVSNRLNIYFEEATADIEACARDFKRLYPEPRYKIIGADREVKWLQIQIPEAERDAIRTRLPEQLSPHRIFIVDEMLFRRDAHASAATLQARAAHGWHLEAVQAPQAWQITRGSPSVRIAVVDDGLEVSHPMFANQKGLQVYNVFTRRARVAKGEGHGTHVAGIALGNHSKLAGGAAGIAPNCQLTVVQVGDNGHIPTSALISGIMYALNHGADVVNVSIGDMTRRISRLSEQEQRRMAQTRFKNRERVWSRIYSIARRRRAILVFAAGNESILACVSPMLRSRYTVNVTATAPNGQLTPFSNYGTGSHIAAPGADIYSAVPGQRYESMDGTSMAAPIVTGAVALMRSLDSTLEVERVVRILRATAKRTNRHESPLLQIADALRAVQRGGASAQPGGDALGEGARGGGKAERCQYHPLAGAPCHQRAGETYACPMVRP